MATLINQANTTGIAYDSGASDISTAYWSYAFGDAMLFKVYCGTPSSMWQKNPTVYCSFYRYSISSQSWIQLDNILIGKNNARVYGVNTTDTSLGAISVSYHGADSYLFAFKAQQGDGERSRCSHQLRVLRVGSNNNYNTNVKNTKIFGRTLDLAFRYNRDTSGPASLPLTDSWLTTTGLTGTQITTALIPRIISAKYAISRT